jgi:hypothetical protein
MKEFRYVDAVKGGYHNHIFEYCNTIEISSFFNPVKKKIIQNFEGTIKRKPKDSSIEKQLAILSGKDGLSFSQLSSDNLWNFIFYCMNLMNDNNYKENQINPHSLINQPTRKNVASYVEKEGPIQFKALKQVYSKQYVSLSFDGGEFNGTDYYVGIIKSPYNPNIPALLVCFEQNIKSQLDFAKIVAEVVMEISKFCFIMNICVDGLKHQIQASHLFPTSTKENFQNFIEKKNFPLPFLLPDIAHIFQLVLTHAKSNKKKYLQLNSYFILIDKIGNEIRRLEAVKLIGAKCPTYPSHRFFYIVLKIQFMLRKRCEIINYYKRFFIISY